MDSMIELPESFERRILDLHGRAGRTWLEDLQALIRSLEERWKIQVAKPFTTLTYNYVAPAIRNDGSEAILKLGVPGEHFEREAQCLRHYDGDGAPYLLECDLELGGILMERIRPGSDVKHREEDEAIEAAASVMQRLHRAPVADAKMPTINDWWKGFHRLRERFAGGTGPLPEALVEEAERLYAELASSMGPPVLLHGDLHHENILAGERLPWIAIDPQGVIGESAYEVGAFLRNPVPDLLSWSGLDKILQKRVALFSEILGFDRQRVAGWGFSQAVLSGIWSIEDHNAGWEGSLAVAHALLQLVNQTGS